MKDYVEQLKAESRQAHSTFHQFALALSRAKNNTLFFFFEGDDDPGFYMTHLSQRLAGRDYHTFVCNGRTEVIKTNDLVANDGRAMDRSLFFIDKDHSDILIGTPVALARNIFQTGPYSIENYIVSEDVLKRFWIERLHLSTLDERLTKYMDRYLMLRDSFIRRCRILMAIVLFGRGIDGRAEMKLNLNNVQLDRIFRLEVDRTNCRFQIGAGSHFIASSNMGAAGISVSGLTLRSIYRTYLRSREPKSFVRGKYELWFFWKVLTIFSRELSDRDHARVTGVKRATPLVQLSLAGSIESLSSLMACPPDLAHFLDNRI